MTIEKKKEKSRVITIDTFEKMDTQTDDIFNVGYRILKQLYRELEIDKFRNWKTRNLSVEFSVDQIFRLLVFSRILCPASKKEPLTIKSFILKTLVAFHWMMFIMPLISYVKTMNPYRNGFLSILRRYTIVTFLYLTLTVPIFIF